jgi:non-ribosomal peptide synthetase component F
VRFEEQVVKTPDATAAVYNEERISYGDLNDRANQLACYLVSLGVRPDDRVALCIERSIDMIIAILAILKAGGAYVPIDIEQPQDRLLYMINDSTPVLIITENKLTKRFTELSPEHLVVLDQCLWEQTPKRLVCNIQIWRMLFIHQALQDYQKE